MKKIKDFTAKDWFRYYSALNNEKPVEECGFDLTEEQKAVYNRELKGMVEAYKTRTPQEKSAESRESTREKLDALVKDTAAKLSPEKTPKAKAKTKKGPEL